ncbi:MAG: lysophospholipid acyltransferase family protein [Candidatus Aminicenantales bacterium]
MASFEEEFKRYQPTIQKLSGLSLIGKKIDVRGEENFVTEGPNIIVGNHCGSFKDVATLFKIVPRPIFFTANQMIFSKKEFSYLIRKHLTRHLKNFGFFVNFLLNPFKSLFVDYISSNIAKIGTIPVDLARLRKGEAIERCQEYLKKGRAIIALQGRGRVVPSDPNPYVKTFSRGTSIISFNMYEQEAMAVPVTPLAIFGTQVPLLVPGKVKVNVGKPMYITDYIVNEVTGSINRFRSALEAAVHTLFMELLRT